MIDYFTFGLYCTKANIPNSGRYRDYSQLGLYKGLFQNRAYLGTI